MHKKVFAVEISANKIKKVIVLFVMTKGKVVAALLSYPALLKKATLVHTDYRGKSDNLFSSHFQLHTKSMYHKNSNENKNPF